MQIIVEYVLLNNIIINAIIISLTAKLLAEKSRFVFLSSLFGSITALAFPLFSLHIVLEIILKILVGTIMICISFEISNKEGEKNKSQAAKLFFRKFSLIFSIFLLLTMLLGGACYVLENMIGGKLPIFVPLTVVLVLWRVLTALARFLHKKRSFSSFLYAVCLTAGSICIKEKAYLDSGNTLIDPLTKRPVIVISFSVFEKLFQGIPMEKIPGAHYVKVGTLSAGSKMLMFELDRLDVGNCHHGPVSAGLSLSSFEKSFEANVLLHPQLV